MKTAEQIETVQLNKTGFSKIVIAANGEAKKYANRTQAAKMAERISFSCATAGKSVRIFRGCENRVFFIEVVA